MRHPGCGSGPTGRPRERSAIWDRLWPTCRPQSSRRWTASLTENPIHMRAVTSPFTCVNPPEGNCAPTHALEDHLMGALGPRVRQNCWPPIPAKLIKRTVDRYLFGGMHDVKKHQQVGDLFRGHLLPLVC